MTITCRSGDPCIMRRIPITLLFILSMIVAGTAAPTSAAQALGLGDDAAYQTVMEPTITMLLSPGVKFAVGSAMAQTEISIDGEAIVDSVDGEHLQQTLGAEPSVPAASPAGGQSADRRSWTHPSFGYEVSWDAGSTSLGATAEGQLSLSSAEDEVLVIIEGFVYDGQSLQERIDQSYGPLEEALGDYAETWPALVEDDHTLYLIAVGDSLLGSETFITADGSALIQVTMTFFGDNVEETMAAYRSSVLIDGHSPLEGIEQIYP
jgi:hypothetical protein